MRSDAPGTHTSEIEVTNISKHGFWILLRDRERFLPFTDFPWFKEAAVEQILDVEWPSPGHLYWPGHRSVSRLNRASRPLSPCLARITEQAHGAVRVERVRPYYPFGGDLVEHRVGL